MKTHRILDGSGFITVDFPDAKLASGLVRLAPKILPSGAKELARSATYTFAAFGLKCSGASAAINAKPEDRTTALKAFTEECASFVEEGAFLPDPGKGVNLADLEPLAAKDPRHPIRLSDADGMSLSDRLLGEGAAAAAEAALGGLDGMRVVIEGGGACAIAAAETAGAAGAAVVGIATPAGVCSNSKGLELAAVRELWKQHGEDFPPHLNGSNVKDVLELPADVIFLGSRMGVLNHTKAAKLNVKAVASLHPIPFSTRALVVLQAAGAVVLPDFACLGGPLFAAWPDELAGLANENITEKAVKSAAMDRIKALVHEIVSHQEGAVMGGCYLAESFLKSWREERPFGRPLAP